jgi:hypothetical protein
MSWRLGRDIGTVSPSRKYRSPEPQRRRRESRVTCGTWRTSRPADHHRLDRKHERHLLDRHLADLKVRRVQEVTPSDLARLLRELRASYSPWTCVGVHRIPAGTFALALRRGFVTRSPIDGLAPSERPKQRNAKRIRVLALKAWRRWWRRERRNAGRRLSASPGTRDSASEKFGRSPGPTSTLRRGRSPFAGRSCRTEPRRRRRRRRGFVPCRCSRPCAACS